MAESEGQSVVVDVFRDAASELQQERAASHAPVQRLLAGALAEQAGTIIRIVGDGVYEILSPSKGRIIVHSDSLINLVSTAVKISAAAIPPSRGALSILERLLLFAFGHLSLPRKKTPEVFLDFEPAAGIETASTIEGGHGVQIDRMTSTVLSLLDQMDKAGLEPTVSGEETLGELRSNRAATDKRIAAARLRMASASR
jgi:hypothetical protein